MLDEGMVWVLLSLKMQYRPSTRSAAAGPGAHEQCVRSWLCLCCIRFQTRREASQTYRGISARGSVTPYDVLLGNRAMSANRDESICGR